MALCGMCEATLPDKAAFCDACGTPVPRASRGGKRKSSPAKKAATKSTARKTAKKTTKAASPLQVARSRAGVKKADEVDGLEAENAARGELKELTFFVSGQPIQQGSMKAVGAAGRGLLIDIKANELKKWRPAVAKAALEAGVGYAPRETPVYVDVVFCLLKPASAKRDTPCALIDLDKLCRAVGDSLSDVAYKDDRQNVNWNASKVYVTDEANLGALIRLGEWTAESADRKPLLNSEDYAYVVANGSLPPKALATRADSPSK